MHASTQATTPPVPPWHERHLWTSESRSQTLSLLVGPAQQVATPRPVTSHGGSLCEPFLPIDYIPTYQHGADECTPEAHSRHLQISTDCSVRRASAQLIILFSDLCFAILHDGPFHSQLEHR
jgi:hypothetical protein